MSEDGSLSESKATVDAPRPHLPADVGNHLTEVFLDLECFSAGELSKLCISKDFFGPAQVNR